MPLRPSAADAPRACASYAVLDEALARLAPYGPELSSGLTSHAPMVVEALCALDRADAVMPWLERYRSGLVARAPVGEAIDAAGWRGALGRVERFSDWAAFFARALAEAPWRDVVRAWGPRLAPGLAGDATHGVIRVGHAVRALERGASPARLHELADALALLASSYQALPCARAEASERGPASEAIRRVVLVPEAERRFAGTIVSSLEALADHAPFARAIDLLDAEGDPARRLSEVTETFARVFLANARDSLGAIVFAHGVTCAAAVRSLLPLLEGEAARGAVRYAWQAGCALYAAFGVRPPADEDAGAPPAAAAADDLADRAVAHGDEHAIKLAEACLREHALRPSPAYLRAAAAALALLPAHEGDVPRT